MFGLSQKEKIEKEVSNLVGLAIGLSREIRSLLVKRHPAREVLIESQPRCINAIYYLAAAITQFSWLTHSKGKLPMDDVLDRFHLAIMKETMEARNYDKPPQLAHREYSSDYTVRWREYQDTLHKILVDKRINHVDIFYIQFEEDAFGESMQEGAFTRMEAAQQLLSLVMHALAFSKNSL